MYTRLCRPALLLRTGMIDVRSNMTLACFRVCHFSRRLPSVSVSARPHSQSVQPEGVKADRADTHLQEDDHVFGSLDEDGVLNSEMVADIIINHLEEQALGSTPMAPPRAPTEKPPPSASPPVMPARTTAADLLGPRPGANTPQTEPYEADDTLAISSDVQWQFGEVSQSTISEAPGADNAKQVPSVAITGPQNMAEAPSLSFGGSCLLTGIILYAMHLGQQAETVVHGTGVKAMALLRQRQHQDFRAQYDANETDGKTAEERIQSARAKAAKAEKEKARQQQEYAEVAAREAARHKRMRDKARQEYEAAEARREEDLAKRIAAEQELSRQRAEERRKAEEALHKAQEEEAQKAAAEKQEMRLREQAAAQAAARAIAEERAALQKQRQMFVVRANGRAAASKARPGLVTDGPVTLPAAVEMAAEVSNVLVGELGPITRGAATLDEGKDLAISVGGEVSNLFRQANIEAFSTQHVTGKGPLKMMDQLEVQHWMNQACMVVHAAATAALRLSIDELAQDGLEKPKTKSYALKLERGVLPVGHDRHTNALLTQRIIDVQESGAAAQERLNASLDSLVEEEEPWVRPGLVNCGEQVAGVQFLVDISVASHILDRASALQPSDGEDACECNGVMNGMVCAWLTGRLQGAPPDGLLDIAEMTCWTLGDEHPVAKHVLHRAEKNMSNARKQIVVERQRALDALMADRLLEQERKSARELSDEQALEKEALIPVPERVWALRNIAATMALGDRSSRVKARELYSKAVELQREYLGSHKHPGLLGELWRLAELLQREVDWHLDASATWEECLGVLEEVVSRYRGQGDLVSATVLAEGTCAALETLLGPDHPGMKRLIMSADTMFSALDEAEQEQVLQWRGTNDSVERLMKSFTKALRPYEVLTGNNNINLWDAGHIEPLMK